MKQTNTKLLGALVRVLVGSEYLFGTVFSMRKMEYLVEVELNGGFTAVVAEDVCAIALAKWKHDLPTWDTVIMGYDTCPAPNPWVIRTPYQGGYKHWHMQYGDNEHVLVNDSRLKYALSTLTIVGDKIRYEWLPVEEGTELEEDLPTLGPVDFTIGALYFH